MLLRHDAPLIAAVLGVLKAGGTAAVLSTRDPAARLAQIGAELEPDLLLVDAAHRDLALAAGFDGRLLVDVPECPTPGPRPGVTVAPGDVAFVIFTSGSTGRPRGVLQTHRNLIHNALLRLAAGLGLRSDDRIVLLASPSGGQGLATVWSTLLNGSTLCPFPAMERGVTGLADWLSDHEVSVVTASASVFRHFARTLDGERLETVRLLRLGSEPALRQDFAAFRRHFDPGCEFANTFSASETGNITQFRLAPGADFAGDSLPLGRPVAGVEVLLLDERGEPVAPGEEGEIVIRGRFLSPGYWRDDSLTRMRFAGGDSARVFRTGDLGRLGDGGLLRWSARRDTQVKVHGNRVDLSEVEAALLARPEIAAAAVCARPGKRGTLSLTGYVTPRDGDALDTAGLRTALRERLPEHALPTAFVSLDPLPLTSHGKIDRGRLALLDPPEHERPAPAEPVSQTEELLAGIWARAFEIEAVDRDDNFFDLGGDSLVAAVIAAGVHTNFGVELELGSFIEHPTVAAQAVLVERARLAESEPEPIPRVSRSGPLPLSFAQERTWETAKDADIGAGYTMARGHELRGPLDVDALRRCIERLFRRHEILRAGVTELEDGRPAHVIQPPAPVDLPLIDLSGERNPAAAAAELLEREARQTFDPRKPPLLRFQLVRLADEHHQLLRYNHHIISDGWSWQIFGDELARLYEADLLGEAPPLSDEPPLQFVDYAAWERSAGQAEARRAEERAWWRAELAGSPGPIELTFARRERRDGANPREGAIWWGLGPAQSAGLDRLAREAGATFLMSRLAVFAAQLAFDTGRDDMVLGSYVTGRRRAETQALFGFFSNLATLRLHFDPALSFQDWLVRVRDKVVAVSARCETPYELLREELAADGFEMPAIEAIFAVSAYGSRRFAGIEEKSLRRATEVMPWGFTWAVDRAFESDRCLITMDPRRYDPRGARAMVGRVQRLVGRVGARPDLPLGAHRARWTRLRARLGRAG